jgi:hypothetical protein
LYPCLTGAMWSIAPLRRRGSGPQPSFGFVINSTMFSYPPCLLIHVHENLVSDGQGSLPTMHSIAGIGT